MSTQDIVRELLAAHIPVPESDGSPLGLPSLGVVMVAEALEERFSFRILASELRPEHFETLAQLVAFVERKRR